MSMNYLILIVASLMLLRNVVAVRHLPSVPNILLLLFWMSVVAYSVVPSPPIFVVSSALVVLALVARIFPARAQALGERIGLPEVNYPPQDHEGDPGAR